MFSNQLSISISQHRSKPLLSRFDQPLYELCALWREAMRTINLAERGKDFVDTANVESNHIFHGLASLWVGASEDFT